MTTKRKPISKKLRFEIFKRDFFTCQYCGAKPPSVVLELDHIKPVSKGGNNLKENLLTSCFECNRGKGAVSLSDKIKPTDEIIALRKEKSDQINELNKLARSERRRLNKYVSELDDYFQVIFECGFSDRFKISVYMFIEKIGQEKVQNAIDIAITKTHEAESCLKYFCGICWTMIREEQNA